MLVLSTRLSPIAIFTIALAGTVDAFRGAGAYRPCHRYYLTSFRRVGLAAAGQVVQRRQAAQDEREHRDDPANVDECRVRRQHAARL